MARLLAEEAGRLCVVDMPYKAAGRVAEEARQMYVAELAERHFVAEQLCMTGRRVVVGRLYMVRQLYVAGAALPAVRGRAVAARLTSNLRVCAKAKANINNT